jgi:hypothetical protein
MNYSIINNLIMLNFLNLIQFWLVFKITIISIIGSIIFFGMIGMEGAINNKFLGLIIQGFWIIIEIVVVFWSSKEFYIPIIEFTLNDKLIYIMICINLTLMIIALYLLFNCSTLNVY